MNYLVCFIIYTVEKVFFGIAIHINNMFPTAIKAKFSYENPLVT